MYSDKQIKDIFFELEENQQLFQFQFRGFSMYFISRFYLEITVRNEAVPLLSVEKKVNLTPQKAPSIYQNLLNWAYGHKENLVAKLLIAVDWRVARWQELREKNKVRNIQLQQQQHINQTFDTTENILKSPFLFVSTSGLMDKQQISKEMPDIMSYFHKKKYPIVLLQCSAGSTAKRTNFYDQYFLLADSNDKIEALTNNETEQIKLFVDFLRQKLNVKLNNFEATVASLLYHQYIKAKNLLYYIEKTQCKYVFTRSLYSDPWVIMACAIAGVKCVEVQHGPLYPDLIYYQSSLPIHLLGKNTLLIPDYILTIGQVWKELIIQMNYFYTENNVFNVGDHEYSALQAPKVTQKQASLTILLAGQAGIFNIVPEIAAFIEKYSQLLEEYHIKLIIRPHPLHRDSTIDNLYTTYSHIVTLQDTKQINIYEALPDVDVVVSASSTCLYQAVALGKFGITFRRFEGQVYPSDLLLVENIDDFWEVLLKIRKKELTTTPKPYISPSNLQVLDYFFTQ
jgi:hypothetical protein